MLSLISPSSLPRDCPHTDKGDKPNQIMVALHATHTHAHTCSTEVTTVVPYFCLSSSTDM